jgi:hypothetical protein
MALLRFGRLSLLRNCSVTSSLFLLGAAVGIKVGVPQANMQSSFETPISDTDHAVIVLAAGISEPNYC